MPEIIRLSEGSQSIPHGSHSCLSDDLRLEVSISLYPEDGSSTGAGAGLSSLTLSPADFDQIDGVFGVWDFNGSASLEVHWYGAYWR